MSSDSPKTSREVYVSARPAPAGGNVVRLRGEPDRAKQVLLECDMAELQHALCTVVGMGYCISFTSTSDGGAVSVVVYDGFTRFKAYARSTEHLERSLGALLDAVRGEA